MSKKKILIILIILIVAIALFVFRIGGNKEVVLDSNETVNSSLSNDFVSALLGVERITLDTNLLRTNSFKSLVPSGAFVDPNPSKGRVDPFGDISGVSMLDNLGPSISEREVGFPQNINSVDSFIKISNITSATAVVSVTGVPQGQTVSATVSGSNNTVFPLNNFTYKDNLSEYSSVLTGLSSRVKYIINIQEPLAYSGLQAEFETR